MEEIIEYELERITNKIIKWYPGCDKDKLNLVLMHTNLMMTSSVAYITEMEALRLILKGMICHCVDMIKIITNNTLEEEHANWIGSSMVEVLEVNIKQ